MTALDRLEAELRARRPLFWTNPNFQRDLAPSPAGPAFDDVVAAERRLAWFAPLVAQLFPEARLPEGRVESALRAVPALAKACGGEGECWLVKADSELPVVGSIKARGGFHEIMLQAQVLALRHGLPGAETDWRAYATPAARRLFARHTIAVGSTGNLGLSIGTLAAALGFRAVVHMSSDAKAWKKALLGTRGAQVIEHAGDYGAAVAAGRSAGEGDMYAHFVDDEASEALFLGYAAAALHLPAQLANAGVTVGPDRPLFVYLPCGVGGAPGGIAFGLRHVLGPHAHAVFAEPVASPAMLLRLARGAPVSVREIGLDNQTLADGLAVGQASELAAVVAGPLVSAAFTVPDYRMLQGVAALWDTEGLKAEPSAAAGLPGPGWLMRTPEGRAFLRARGIDAKAAGAASHLLWLTGGQMVPPSDFESLLAEGRMASEQA